MRMNTNGGGGQQLFSSGQLLSCRKADFIVIRLADFPVKSEISLDGDFNSNAINFERRLKQLLAKQITCVLTDHDGPLS